jgi:hypothetical protein
MRHGLLGYLFRSANLRNTPRAPKAPVGSRLLPAADRLQLSGSDGAFQTSGCNTWAKLRWPAPGR